MNTNIEEHCVGAMPRKSNKTLITFPFAIQQNGTHSVEVVGAAKTLCVLSNDAFVFLREQLGEKTAIDIEAKLEDEYNRLRIIHSLIISRS